MVGQLRILQAIPALDKVLYKFLSVYGEDEII